MASLARACGSHTGQVTGIKGATMRFGRLIGATRPARRAARTITRRTIIPTRPEATVFLATERSFRYACDECNATRGSSDRTCFLLGASISVPRTRDVQRAGCEA